MKGGVSAATLCKGLPAHLSMVENLSGISADQQRTVPGIRALAHIPTGVGPGMEVVYEIGPGGRRQMVGEAPNGGTDMVVWVRSDIAGIGTLSVLERVPQAK